MKLIHLVLALFSFVQPLSAQILLTVRADGQEYALSRTRLPRMFAADSAPLRNTLSWRALRTGMEWSEFTAEAGRRGVDVRVTVLRVQPACFQFSLVQRTRANRMTGAWNVALVPDSVVLALNAGQFKETGPWGWLVLEGSERRDPGYGPLSVGIAFDSTGGVRWIPFRDLAAARTDASVRFAFQSYPALLLDGRVPALASAPPFVDQHHRDARLILGQDDASRLLVILTRYDGLGRTGARVPIGLTLPESIVLAGALGARHAVMLDGGISAQLLVRDQSGATRTWKGLRDVPLALIATPR